MGVRAAAGAALRRMAPRTFESLEKVAVLEAGVQGLRADVADLGARLDALGSRADGLAEVAARIRSDVEEARRRGGVADDAIAALHGRTGELEASVGELDEGLAESRRLSRRVAQLADLVFDRLVAEKPSVRPEEATAGPRPGSQPD